MLVIISSRLLPAGGGAATASSPTSESASDPYPPNRSIGPPLSQQHPLCEDVLTSRDPLEQRLICIARARSALLHSYGLWELDPRILSCVRESALSSPAKGSCCHMCCHRCLHMGSWARPEVPRLDRVCQLCGAGTLGDERHLVFECPDLLCFREQWSHLFEGPQTMQAFMWQEDLIGIVRFINACLHKMNPMGLTSDQPGVAGRDVI